jgi:hypothetical protein
VKIKTLDTCCEPVGRKGKDDESIVTTLIIIIINGHVNVITQPLSARERNRIQNSYLIYCFGNFK